MVQDLSPTGAHIFDILGVGAREDSYTDLIAYAFDHDDGFRRAFLHFLREQATSQERGEGVGPGEIDQADGWQCRTREIVPVGEARARLIPDLVIVNEATGQIIVIENKLLSGEGPDQTTRYADDECKSELAKLVAPREPCFRFYYLTLEGDKPACDDFVPVSYEAVAELVQYSQAREGKLAILLEEFRERVMGYYEYPQPDKDTVVLDYLKRQEQLPERQLVTRRRRFSVLASSMAISEELEQNPSLTANRGCGYIPLCEFYKPTWVGERQSIEKHTAGARCYHVHFELQWNTCNDQITLYLHYHTWPWMRQTLFRALPAAFRSDYLGRRRAFHEVLRGRADPLKESYWQLRRSYLQLASCEITPRAGFAEFNERVRTTMDQMTPLIDEALEVHLLSK